MTETRRRHDVAKRVDGAPARILVADEDADFRARLATMLRHDGYDVTEQSHGDRALAELGVREGCTCDAWDLVICAIQMTVPCALDLLEAARHVSAGTPLIVAAVPTPFGNAITRRRARALDVTLFDKPFDVDDLRTAVLILLSRKKEDEIAASCASS